MIKYGPKLLSILAISTVLAAALYVARESHLAPEASSNESMPDPILWRDIPLTLQIQIPPDSTLDVSHLQIALSKMEPFWKHHRASDYLHSLRLWGPACRFPAKSTVPVPEDIAPIDCESMLAFFLDQASFAKVYPFAKPYFVHSPHGLVARTGISPSTTPHSDDFLLLAAELGLSAKTKLHWLDRDVSVEDLIRHRQYWALENTDIDFTVAAFARYVRGDAAWQDRFGRECSLDIYAQQLVQRHLAKSCYGTHTLYALASLYATDVQAPCLLQATRESVRSRLLKFSHDLTDSQSAAGFWSRHWSPELADADAMEDEHTEWVRCTGHHLEWIALLPADLRPGDAVVHRAAQFLLATLRDISPLDLYESRSFCPLNHAARALVVLTGHRYAADVMADNWSKR